MACSRSRCTKSADPDLGVFIQGRVEIRQQGVEFFEPVAPELRLDFLVTSLRVRANAVEYSPAPGGEA